jgi:glycosidase
LPYGLSPNGYSGEDFGTLFEGGDEFQLTVHSEDYTTPDWLKGGVIYQIFPDRFKRVGDITPRACQRLREDWGAMPDYLPVNGEVLNNDFFGGNLKGITSALPYIKGLGVTAIYLNPIFEARSNHRYDTGDYMKVDTLLGSEADLKELFSTAKKMGIRVVLDGVFNHTGDDSIYFNRYGTYDSVGAYNSKKSKYSGWYCFNSFPNEYDSWWGIKTLPQTNEFCPSFRSFICEKNGVLRHYLRLGASGWRLDVVDELPSDFVDEIRTAVKAEKPDAVIIGEVWENVTDKIAYGYRRRYFQGGELDSAMNYPLKNAIISYMLSSDAGELVSVIRQQTDDYPEDALNCMMNLLGTHDTPRIVNILSGVPVPNGRTEQACTNLTEEQLALGVKRLKIATAIEYTLYGVPTVYYGDEAALTGWADPFNRGCMDWESKGSLVDWYTRLGEIRRKSQVFKDGRTEIEHAGKRVLIFSREKGGEKIYTAVNLATYPVTVNFTSLTVDLLSGESGQSFVLEPCSVRILEEKQ